MRTTLGRWGRIPTGTPPAREGTTTGGRQSHFRHSRGWGHLCPRPRKTGPRFFLKREKRAGEPKAEGEPAAGGAHSAAGGSGGAPWRPPQRFRAAQRESGRGRQGTDNRPPAGATRGRHVGTSARTSPLGRLRLGFTQAPFSPVPASPENRSNSKSNGQSAAGYAVRLARSRSLPSGRVWPIAVPGGTAGACQAGGGW